MRILLQSRSWYIAGAIVAIAVVLIVFLGTTKKNTAPLVTAVAESGSVREFVSVSGFIEAKKSAKLAFPITGIVADVVVAEGDVVSEGQTLITLNQSALLADRQAAVASLQKAHADRTELINGPSATDRAVTDTTVAIALANVARVEAEQAERTNNAERALYSGSLAAYAVSGEISQTPPTVSGTWNCTTDAPTSYTIETFRSNSASGFSYRYRGHESGTETVYTEQSGALGACGLRLQFDPNDTYGNTTWTIPVPNPNGVTYVANTNSLELAKQQALNANAAAAEQLVLAEQQASVSNAAPRSEALARANAAITSANAALSAIDAALADRELTAPFAGVVTSLDVLPGETVTTQPIITVLAEDAFALTSRIPEIDITKILEGQRADVFFDAETTTNVPATIGFISPQAVEIDGVGYFEATLDLAERPTWLRAGLNADIDIIVAEERNVVRVPSRFVTTTEGSASVTVLAGETQILTPVDIVLQGNDGYVAVDGIEAGTTIVAP